MKVTLERPVTWIESERDGERNRLMYANLLQALHTLGADVSETDVHYGRDFVERKAPPSGILISYHSVGNAPNVWRLKETPIPFFYNIDKLGYSGWSELSVDGRTHAHIVDGRNANDGEEYCKSISEWLVKENLSKYRQGNQGLPTSDKFVLFPMQVRYDSVAVHNRIDPLIVLHEAARISKARKKLLLVKRHPYCTSKKVAFHLMREQLFNKYVKTTEASVTSLLSACDTVLVGNSGVGLEAIIYGKPVYSFAKSEYEIATYPIQRLMDIKSAFSGVMEPHPRGYKFGRYFLKERCFDARDPIDICTKLHNLIGVE